MAANLVHCKVGDGKLPGWKQCGQHTVTTLSDVLTEICTRGQLEHAVRQLVRLGFFFQMPYFQVALLVTQYVLKTWKFYFFSLFLVRVLGKCEGRENVDIYFFNFSKIWPNQKRKVFFTFYTIFHLFPWAKAFLFPGGLSQGGLGSDEPTRTHPFSVTPFNRPPEEPGCCRWPALHFEVHIVLSTVSQAPLDSTCVCPMVVERNLLPSTWNLVFTWVHTISFYSNMPIKTGRGEFWPSK